jgi:hypothetical protein
MIPENDFGSDLMVLSERCIKNQILSPVRFSWNCKPWIFFDVLYIYTLTPNKIFDVEL